MTKANQSVTYLKKVNLLIRAGTSLHASDLTFGTAGMELVFGVGSHGLTPFETQLADKKVGCHLDFEIPAEGLNVFFGHVFPPLHHLPGSRETIFLHIEIDDITRAESREIVKALAEVARCGDHCCGH
jgi:hypothetical protein